MNPQTPLKSRSKSKSTLPARSQSKVKTKSTHISKSKPSKQSLRQIMTKKRASLSTALKRKKANALKKVLKNLPDFIKAQNIAFYWPRKAEIDPRPLLNLALKMGKSCYLPILHPSKAKQLLFVEYHAKDPLRLNRYGIHEPILSKAHRPRLSPSKFDIILLPLLAFNKKGQRLGSGGGYYDKTFAFLKNDLNLKKDSKQDKTNQKKRMPNPKLNSRKLNPQKPQLIGLAYSFQERDKLPQDTWDLVLSGVATEKALLIF